MFVLIILGHFVVSLSFGAKIAWLEQISRQEILLKGCTSSFNSKNKQNVNITSLDHILVDKKHKLIYCYVPKVGCTNWKRVFMVLTDKSNVTNLWDIPASIAHATNSTTKISNLPELEALDYLDNFTSFLMVRHPFERLLSAFRNKLEDKSESAKYFQTRIGRYIVKKYRPNATSDEIESGMNITFREFAQYLIKEGATNELTNEHWMPVNDLCQPCLVNYTFIGKYEWFEEDARTILDMVSAPYIDFPVSKPNYTREKLKFYFQQLSLSEIEDLYNLYKLDFKLFGYDLNPILGFDIG